MASIFVHDSIIENELAFLEDFLDSVYQQLTPLDSAVSPALARLYDKFTNARHTGRQISLRIDLIAEALQQRVSDIRAHGLAFLVIDNLDQCSPAVSALLQRALSQLQQRGLSIMLTSRFANQDTLRRAWCDYRPGGSKAPKLVEDSMQFYWRCQNCEEGHVCEACYAKGKPCWRW